MRKGFAQLLLVIPVLVLLIGTAIFFYYTQSKSSKTQVSNVISQSPNTQPTQTVIPSPNPTSSANTAIVNTPGFYEDKNSGFSFSYPKEIVYADWSIINNDFRISVFTAKLQESNKEITHENLLAAIEEEKALKNNQPLESGGFTIKGSSKIINLGKVNGISSTTLGEWDTCSVMFKHKLTFYNNRYQINIMLYGPDDKIVSEMPQYFNKPPTEASGCGGGGVPFIWSQADKSFSTGSSMYQFYNDVKAGKGSASTMGWWNDFDKIVASVKVY